MTAEVMESSRPERTHKVLSLHLKILLLHFIRCSHRTDGQKGLSQSRLSVCRSLTSLQEVNLWVWIQLFFCISNEFGSPQQIISSHLAGTLGLARPSREIRFYDRHIWFDMGLFYAGCLSWRSPAYLFSCATWSFVWTGGCGDWSANTVISDDSFFLKNTFVILSNSYRRIGQISFAAL